jgi:hypothetical protein
VACRGVCGPAAVGRQSSQTRRHRTVGRRRLGTDRPDASHRQRSAGAAFADLMEARRVATFLIIAVVASLFAAGVGLIAWWHSTSDSSTPGSGSVERCRASRYRTPRAQSVEGICAGFVQLERHGVGGCQVPGQGGVLLRVAVDQVRQSWVRESVPRSPRMIESLVSEPPRVGPPTFLVRSCQPNFVVCPCNTENSRDVASELASAAFAAVGVS